SYDAWAAAIERVIRRNEVDRRPSCGDRNAQSSDYFLEIGLGAAQVNTGADQQHGATGVAEAADNFSALFVQSVGRLCLVLFRIKMAQSGSVDLHSLEVHRNVDPAWTWPPRRRHVPSLPQFVVDVLRTAQQHSRLGDFLHHGYDVDLLVAQLSQARYILECQAGLTLYLTRNDDHRNRIGKSAENPIECVDTSWPRRDLQKCGPAAHSCVRFRRHRARLFMVAADILNLRTAPHRVVEMHRAATGDHESLSHAEISQRFNDKVGESDHHDCGAAAPFFCTGNPRW